jgi:poly[(R)-3-hydroxyalkanoate] polymerase subunit PhaE
METPFRANPPDPDAAFAGAAARFFELLKTFTPPLAGPGVQAPDWTALAGTLAAQFEQWLGASPAAGASFAAAAGFPGGPAWSAGPVPLGPAAAPGQDAQSAWELLMRLGELQGQLAAYWSEIANNSAQSFIARMRAAAGPNLTSESSLALYETWVECAEEAYAATVRKEEFCRLQAQLANTAMGLLLAQRTQAGALARGWGLPTREEADAMQRQIRELQQQLAAGAPRAAERRTPRSRAAPRPQAAPPRGGGRSRHKPARRGRR